MSQSMCVHTFYSVEYLCFFRNYDRDRCDCRPSCEDVTFKPASVSSLRWPSEASWAYKAHQYGVK